jgi:hypothetical protein
MLWTCAGSEYAALYPIYKIHVCISRVVLRTVRWPPQLSLHGDVAAAHYRTTRRLLICIGTAVLTAQSVCVHLTFSCKC